MTIACLSTNASNEFALSGPAQTLFVATTKGVIRLERGVDGWERAALALDGEHIASLAYDAASNTLFAARLPGSLLASRDLGVSWSEASSGVREAGTYSTRLISEDGRSTLYLGTQPPALYRSDDLGQSWTDIAALRGAPMHERWQFPAPGHEPHVKTMAIDPRDPQVIYVGIEQGALLKSCDGGKSWVDLDEFVDYEHFVYKDLHQIKLRPGAPDTVYITTGLGIFRSDNGGANWRQLTGPEFRIGYPDQLHFAPGDPQRMIVAGGFATPNFWIEPRSARGTVMISDDGGESWRAPRGGFPEGRANVEAMTLVSWTDGWELFAGTTDGDLFHSADGGENWRTLCAGLPPVSKPTHEALIEGMGY